MRTWATPFPLAVLDSFREWLGNHPWLPWIGAGVSLVLLLASAVLIPFLIVRLPADYLTHDRQERMPWATAHPALRIVLVILKNVLGVLLILLGIVLSLPMVPGPGILATLAGLALVDIPARRKLMRWIATRDWVFSSINKLRTKHGKPPLEKPHS